MSEKTAKGGVIVMAHGVVKTTALLVGGPLVVLSLMALVGLVTDNLWVRLGVALVTAVGVPLFLADRLLPKDDPSKGRGIPSDVFAVAWLGLSVLMLLVAGPIVAAEGQRLSEDGLPRVGGIVTALSGSESTTSATEAVDEELDGGAADDAQVTDVADDAAADGTTADAGADAADAAADAEAEADDEAPTVSTEDLTPAELFQRWSASVVSVRVGMSGMGGGTGFIIDADGTIATNQHVTNGGSLIRVKLVDGTWASRVELLYENAEVDIALLKIEANSDLQPVLLGDADAVQVGERAISIGNPLGLDHTVTDGLVSARRLVQGRRMIQMSTPVSPGNSGGPLFNLRGEVIGVTTSQIGMFNRGQNLNLAVPVDVLKEQIKDDYPDRRSVGGGEPNGTGSW
ncbi:MAG: trypsin-like peptidase domain-containing protein [Deltaproteobacteria bacterium]|nr:trypsin-like peptidase domain-containing protein [Deltaproteobacteria bacterium]